MQNILIKMQNERKLSGKLMLLKLCNVSYEKLHEFLQFIYILLNKLD